MLRGLSLLSIASGASAQSLKVFLMLGQSNMEGQGIVAIDGAPGVGNGTLEYLALNPPTSVPVVGVASAVILLGDPLTWQKVVALTMVLGSIVMTQVFVKPARYTK